MASAWLIDTDPASRLVVDARPAVAVAASVAPHRDIALLDPAFSLGYAPAPLTQNFPVASNLEPIAPAAPAPITEPAKAVPAAVPADPELVQDVPLPAARPPEFRVPPITGPIRPPGRQIAQRNRTTGQPVISSDNRTFFEKLFGVSQPSGPVLAYAAPGDVGLGSSPNLLSTPIPYDRWTAVYDIAAHTVTMPNGAKLEAHSGLGARLDDPRYVHERMRGATPPHVYELAPREQLFHGVQALRLNPVGGGGTFGRTGLLAHTFMLGPNGDSNGCVSIRNYNAFLQAFQNGEIKRLAVVARSI